MFVKLFLIGVVIVQISANPLLRALMPNCPICRNGSKNPLAQLAPMFLPPPPPQNQPCGQENMDARPRCARTANQCNVCQPCMPQNNGYYPYPPPQNQPCPSNPVCPQNNPNAEIFNKVFSLPALKTIMDPNTKLFNQNGAEIPKHGPCNNGVPNVINNYIIVPPEVLIEDVCTAKEAKPIAKEQEVQVENRGRNGKRRRPKPDRQRDDQRTPPPPPLERVKEQRKPRDRDQNRHAPHRRSGHEQRRDRNPRRRPKNNNNEVKLKTVDEKTNGTKTIIIEAPLPQSADEIKSKNDDSVIIETSTSEPSTQTPAPKIANLSTNVHTDNYNKDDLIDTEPLKENGVIEKNIKPSDIVTVKPNENRMDHNIEDNFESTSETSAKIQNFEGDDQNTRLKEIKSDYLPGIKQFVSTKEDAIVFDIKEQYPALPETLIKDLLQHMKLKVEDDELRKLINDKDQIVPDNNDTVSEIKDNESTRLNEKRKRKNSRRHRLNAPESNSTKSPSTTESVSTPMPTTTSTTTTTTTTTTEKPSTEGTTTKSTVPHEEITPAILTVTVRPTKNTVETTTNRIDDDLPSIESVDTELKYLGDDDYYIAHDDYYPIFTDRQYFSDEVYSYSRPGDSIQRQNRESRRYEDGVDKEPKSKTTDRHHFFRMPQRFTPRHTFLRRLRPSQKNTENSITKPKVIEVTTANPKTIVTFVPLDDKPETVTEVHKEITLNHESSEHTTEKINIVQEIEKIQFQTPPLLDKIDFETKPINKNFYYHDDDHKISTYSDFKTPQYNVSEKSKNVKPVDKIETVYARSKVVKYGQPNSEEILAKSKLDDFSNLFGDKDHSYVIAKSIDDYW